MQHLSTTNSLSQTASRGGGRVASHRYRQSLQLCEDFEGLEENVNRYDLLLLVKRVGKAARFPPPAIQLLDYYMAYTRDIDWEQGSRPIVYQSLARTALDLDVSERQIQLLEQRLFNLGAITFNDSGNHRRYGQRDAKTGRIIYAFGVDLTPLSFLKEELQQKFHEKQLYDEAWMETKRQISWYRRQIRSVLLEWEQGEGTDKSALQSFERRYEEIAVQLRTHIDLLAMRTLLERHSSLHSELLEFLGVGSPKQIEPAHASNSGKTAHKDSSRGERTFVHYKSTTHQSSDKSDTGGPADKSFQESVTRPPERQANYAGNETAGKGDGCRDRHELILATGLQHITLKHVLQAASDRIREQLPVASRPVDWIDIVEAAYRLRPQLHISQQSWAEACTLLGREGAAVCLLLVDRATERPENPVTNPAAYFRGMINKARAGELRLQGSVFARQSPSDQRKAVAHS